MRLRIKFTKTGQLKYIGHLDVMRYFQKVLRRAKADVVFSGGFSPHMIMSFALPLGVGVTSCGEYFDVDVRDGYDYEGLIDRMNEQTSKDMRVLNVVRVSDKKADKCMTVVEAADYLIDLCDAEEEIVSGFEGFLSEPRIMAVKKSKSGEKLTDIRPMIIGFERMENNSYIVRLAAGSRAHLNPQLLADTYMKYRADNEAKQNGYKTHIKRLEMYALENGEYVPLDKCSGVIN